MKQLSEEEAKYLAPDAGSTIIPRKDGGLPKKVNDKIESLINEQMKQWQLEKRLKENAELKLLAKPRLRVRTKLSRKLSKQSMISYDSPTKTVKSFLNVDDSPSPQPKSPTRSITKSPVKKSTMNLRVLLADEDLASEMLKPDLS